MAPFLAGLRGGTLHRCCLHRDRLQETGLATWAGPQTGKTEGAAAFLPGTHHSLSRPVIIEKFIYQLCSQHAFIKQPQYQALQYAAQTWLVFVELQSGGGAVASPQRSSSVEGGVGGDMVKEQLSLRKGKEATVVGAWERGSVSTDRTQEVSWACG